MGCCPLSFSAGAARAPSCRRSGSSLRLGPGHHVVGRAINPSRRPSRAHTSTTLRTARRARGTLRLATHRRGFALKASHRCGARARAAGVWVVRDPGVPHPRWPDCSGCIGPPRAGPCGAPQQRHGAALPAFDWPRWLPCCLWRRAGPFPVAVSPATAIQRSHARPWAEPVEHRRLRCFTFSATPLTTTAGARMLLLHPSPQASNGRLPSQRSLTALQRGAVPQTSTWRQGPIWD